MWEHVDRLLASSPSSLDVLRVHRVELLEARRRQAAGLELGRGLIADQTRAQAISGLVIVLLGVPVYFIWRKVESAPAR